MEWGVISDSSIVFGGIVVLASAVIGSVTLLWITYRKRRDDKIREVKVQADTHRQLWHVLEQIVANENRERDEWTYQTNNPGHPLANTFVDDKWLQEYFRDNAALLDTELHDIYEKALGVDIITRYALRIRTKSEEDPDIRDMIDIAKRKTEEYDRRCREINGRNSLK